ASKACAEIVFHSYRKSFFEKQPEKKIASARAGNVIGGGDWAVDRIVPDCVRAWENKKNPNIRNPKSTRPWQHVLEPLGGYLVLGACLFQGQKDVIGQSFNFGPGQDAVQTVDVLLRKMTAEWGNDVSWIVATPLDSHKKESNLLQLNCDRAWNRLGWKSKLSFDEAVQMTTLWYQSHLKEPKSLVDLTKKQIASYQIKLEANV
ncbi:MAG: CDP-glucose 4,6-dehydratase, partial [Pseudobdellovibrionaceae bacterium]